MVRTVAFCRHFGRHPDQQSCVGTSLLMAHVYILLMTDGRYYVGSTDDLSLRLRCHIEGEVKTTKSHLPIELVYAEAFFTRAEAQKMEYRIKSWKSGKLIRSLIGKSSQNCASHFMARSSNG